MLDVILFKPTTKSSRGNNETDSKTGDKPLKSLAKTVSWRIIGTMDTMLISYLITGEISSALSIGSIEVFSKMILYYFHERLWSNITKNSQKNWFKIKD